MRFTIKQKKRSAVSPVIATLLLIAIAVAAAIIVYAFVTGLIGGLTSSGASLVVVSGSLTVPSGTGPGTLVITVTNKASNAMNAVAVANDGANPVGFDVSWAIQNGNPASGPDGPSSGPFAVLCSAATEPNCLGGVAPFSTIPIGSSASAVGTIAGATAGTTYTFSVYAYIGTSTTPNIQSFSVTAQI
jgi:flagellin-like protein